MMKKLARFNIYHHACFQNKDHLLKHLLSKLPSSVSEKMLTQKTKEKNKRYVCFSIILFTDAPQPLHIALRFNSEKTAEHLVLHSSAANMIRDGEGSLPLHLATRQGLHHITKLLIDLSPTALFVEDDTGHTAVELASSFDFLDLINKLRINDITDPIPTLASNGPCLTKPTPVIIRPYNKVRISFDRLTTDHLEKELPKLRDTIDRLEKDGRLHKNEKLGIELCALERALESQLRRLRQEPAKTDTKTAGKASEKTSVNHEITLKKHCGASKAKGNQLVFKICRRLRSARRIRYLSMIG